MSLDKGTLDQLRIDRAMAPRRGPFVAVAALLFVSLAAGAGFFFWSMAPRPATVRTALAKETATGAAATLLNSSGYVTARREATVSSKVTGKVMEVLVEEGMQVEADQVLARIDSSNAEKAFALAEAQLVSARKSLEETRANIVLADRELKRMTDLTAQEVTTEADLDRAEAGSKSLKARLERQEADVAVAEREVARWNQELADYTIRAPFAGVVTAKNAQPGEIISLMSAGGGFTRTGICTIVDMSSLEIEVDVSESYINRVQPGLPVEATLDSYPDWKVPAKVIAIIPTADRQKATVKVRVAFDQLDPRVLPEMSVKIAFKSAGENETAQRRVSVPKRAVTQRDGRDVVWVVRDGRVERRAVTLGAEDGEDVAVAAGIAGGEVVVIDAPATLADGDRVTEEKA